MNDSDTAKTLLNLRAEVDAIDLHILDLLKSRMALAKKMGVLKKSKGSPLRDTVRENEILRRLAHENIQREPRLPENDLKTLYVQIMHICLKSQE